MLILLAPVFLVIALVIKLLIQGSDLLLPATSRPLREDLHLSEIPFDVREQRSHRASRVRYQAHCRSH